MSKKRDADMCSYNGEFLSVPHRTHTTQHNNKYNIKQRQRERQTKKTEKVRQDRDVTGRDGTGQDRTGLQTDGNLKRVMVTNYTCLL